MQRTQRTQLAELQKTKARTPRKMSLKTAHLITKKTMSNENVVKKMSDNKNSDNKKSKNLKNLQNKKNNKSDTLSALPTYKDNDNNRMQLKDEIEPLAIRKAKECTNCK